MWLAFVDLAGTRDVGMAAGPISYREIEAYQSQTHALLTAWDVQMIRRMDTAVRAVMAGVKPAKTDVKSIKASLRGAVARLAKRNQGAPNV